MISAEISKLRDGQMSPDTVFRDPYLLDLLGLKGAYSERDLESAILREIEGVLLELGTGFAFVARQKRMSVGKDDFHLDLLFFHRHLRRLIAVELKLESFQPAHVGQMELYLRWLDKHERAPGEEAPIGLILCASADAEQVELLQLDAKSIRVSEYLTDLPPLPLLRERLHQAIEHAREQAARRLPDSRRAASEATTTMRPRRSSTLAGSMRDLQQQAAQQYRPVVDDILRTGSRDAQHIERTLDGLLDFCGHEPVVQMYRQLCLLTIEQN